ncbi:putative class II histone deacetylase complex subunits 2 and 3 [Lyophyllum shimeji]|uniref:Class II histone deacetylase complex subunits 2 and 3 n=1 Tax=Lyophyllum shimeji TaxID=47721 RepID=A0A9P3PID3_LYOSH|nr:putative class II histone deacetylase complex subunits 2 and 3 [Lyophyllum shimeji]
MGTEEPSSDPALLFSPERSLGPTRAQSSPLTETVNAALPRRAFFISPPTIPLAQKKLYQAAKDTFLKDNVEIKVDEVIGEYREGNILYYFARYQGGIAHKFPSFAFVKRHQSLVHEFNRKKASGELTPFDPSAHYVHPLSRVKTTVSISNRRATVNISSARSISAAPELEVVPDSQEEDGAGLHELADDESEGDDEADEYEEEVRPQPSRRTRQSSAKSKTTLPFSPKKTRARQIFVVHSDQESGDSTTLLPTRRSTRSRKGVTVNLDADAYTDDIELSDEDSEAYISTRARGKGKKAKKPVRRKASRPAYGHFRSIEELDYDALSDEESAPLRKHRDICEKCHQAPAHQLLQDLSKKGKAKRKRKTSEDEFEVSGDEKERYTALGGWVRCLKCPVVNHWRCMASIQRDEILKAARDKDVAEWRQAHAQTSQDGEVPVPPEPGKRPGLGVNETTEFICSACMKGGFCMGCMEIALQPDALSKASRAQTSPEAHNGEATTFENANSDPTEFLDDDNQLLFRCLTCKRIAHYAHLSLPPNYSSDDTVADIARFYARSWLCADCASYRFGVDKIIAWRPYPPNAVEPPRRGDEVPNYKDSLPREYLVKWLDRSYRRVQWVPHMWLLSTHHAKLKNFLAGGTKVELLAVGDEVGEDEASLPSFEIADGSRPSFAKPGVKTPALPRDALPDAERRIPLAWKTIDRILDVLLWHPRRGLPKARKGKRKGKQKATVIEDSDEELEPAVQQERDLAFDQGEQPSDDLVETVSEWEARTGERFCLDNIDQVVWAFIKWGDLGYDEATWDSPPRRGDPTYSAFQTALQRFADSHHLVVPKHSASYCETFDKRAKDGYRAQHALKDASDLDIGQSRQLKLMPFQVDGVNWLCNNWWIHQHCILADEMGLGKTVQIATFIGNIIAKFEAFPALVVVPNSTITNWVREFERWAPKLRVVPFYGEAKSRDVIKKFELYHEKKRAGETGAKFHVLITTYEALLNQKDFTPVFKNQPRWEVLVIDEGQRLKSDSSLLFRRLNELNSVHRIIMTGTPLNNNIRELFNLMNFLDPNEWSDLESLEKEHEELTEDLVKQLHNRLRPYFLRRLKSEVLQLPPKNEVIVPVSMTPLQKEVYRSILSHNLELLNGLTQQSKKLSSAPSKGRINNILMELRKCLQHPYLYAEDIEPRGLSPQETHEKLIDASAKLRLLKSLLPKLKMRGHRVLLFSQFVIALNVIEDFLVGEGHKYLRLDGNTKGSERQKGMDEFNKPGSDVFIYLLTTRAGGVGINLFSADTVIIFDPDFNPHQDLQAIARAYRFGQQKTCLVFKLMVKDSAEERIVQVGKKKLALDHLIVQKMDEEDSAGENVQSILTYGAQALFDTEQTSRDISYSDHDIQNLIEKTEKEGEEQTQVKEGMSFAFAKVWAADKDSLEEVEDIDQGDSWAQTLQKITLERAKIQAQEIALSGRGTKRRAAAVSKPDAYRDEPLNEVDKKVPSSAKSVASESSVYLASDMESEGDGDVSSGDAEDKTFEPSHRKSKTKPTISLPTAGAPDGPLSPIHNAGVRNVQYCGLCGGRHGEGPGQCVMTERSENLAEFREILLLHADDEPWERRTAAIEAIDRTLYQRGHIRLIAGQPLHPLRKSENIPPPSAQNLGPKAAEGPITSSRSAQVPGPPQPHPAAPLTTEIRQSSNAVAGPSKRPASPSHTEQSKPKKSKISSTSALPCPVCEQVPHHLVKDCPLVAQGPKSITRQIKRLESDPDSVAVATVRVLRKILAKQMKRERELQDPVITVSD